jgi:hypothetical protein
METLYTYLRTSPNHKLTDTERAQLLELDKEYGKFFREFWFKWDRTDCTNLNEEWEKFKKALSEKEKYYPQIKLVDDKLTPKYLEWGNKLILKFQNFPCFLSKYYIENINYMMNQAIGTIYKTKESFAILNKQMCPKFSEENYKAAWELIKKHPYEYVRKVQNYKGEDIVDMMQKHIDKCKFHYKVELNPYMIARQNVVPHEPVLHIKTDAQFSDLDVESLKIHEVEVHVARRHWGFQTGLNLFVDGLVERNTLDEGMAIYQSLHHNKFGVKPNLEFDIAIKTIIGYHIMDMDFIELYNWLLPKLKTSNNKDVIGFVIFKNLMRFKRVVQDCSLFGGDSVSETDYFCGYQMVKDMPKSLKQDLIKWNIGPGQIKDLPDIKQFFKTNKFTPLN